MSFLRNIIYILLLLPLLVLSACGSSDDPLVPDVPTGESEVAGYLQLTVSTAGNQTYSRATADSEDGDGREEGFDNENNIYDLSIFIYRDLDGQGLDGVDNPIKFSYYYETPDPIRPINWKEIRIPLTDDDLKELSLAGGTRLRTLVIANAGDLTNKGYNEISDLTYYRDYSSAWQGENVAVADRFIMSSAFNGAKRNDAYKRDGLVDYYKSNDEGIIYSCEVTLERVAARIDLQYSPDVVRNDDKTLTYKVRDTEHTVTLLNIVPVNVMQQKSYLVKHLSQTAIADEVSEYVNHFMAADETRDIGIPNNYVLSPSFFTQVLQSNLSNPDDNSELRNWFGDTRASEVEAGKGNPAHFKGLHEMSSFIEPFNIKDSANKGIILTYANENTHPMEAQVVRYKGDEEINPSRVLTGLLFRAQYHPSEVYESEDITNPSQYTDGDDFWLCRDFTDPTAPKHLYFTSEGACLEYMNLEANKDKYFVDPVLYKGGICFYNVWLKHNVLTDDNYPMKYGIVRNNIYRLSVSFKNVGKPDVELDETEFEIEYLLEVVPWKFGGKVHVDLGE